MNTELTLEDAYKKIELAMDNINALFELHPLQILPLASYTKEGLVLARCYLILSAMDDDAGIENRYDINMVIEDLKLIKDRYIEGSESWRLLEDSIILLSNTGNL